MAGVTKDAKITLGVEGADEVAKAADKALRPWESAAKTVGAAVSSAFKQATSDIARAVTVGNAISFAQAIQSARQYREEIGRLTVTTRETAQGLRTQLEAISRRTLFRESDIAGAAKALGRMTYDAGGALKAMGGLAEEAAATGRSVGEMESLGAVLHDILGASGDSTEALGKLRGQAEALGSVGGVAALHDRLVALSDVLSEISTKTDDDRSRLTALVAATPAGFTPKQATRSLGRILGDVTQSSRSYETFFGMKHGELLDEQGHVKDPTAVLERAQKSILRMAHGNRNLARFYASGQFGNEAAAYLMALDFGAVRRGAAAGPSSGAAATVGAFAGSDAGRAVGRQLDIERGMRQGAEGLLPAADAAQGLLASHPIAGTLGLGVAGNLAAQGAGGLFSQMGQQLMNALGTGGAAVQSGAQAGGAALEAAGVRAGAALQGGILGKLGLLGAAGALGYEVGTYLDNKLGISDAVSGVSTIKADADASLARDMTDPERNDLYWRGARGLLPRDYNRKDYADAVERVKRKYSSFVSEDPTQDYERGVSVDPNEIYNAVQNGIKDSASVLQSVVRIQSADGSPIVAVDQAKASQSVAN